MDKSRCKIPRTSLILVMEMNNDNTLLRGGNGLSLCTHRLSIINSIVLSDTISTSWGYLSDGTHGSYVNQNFIAVVMVMILSSTM
jgi:hypothetical protein